METYAIYDSTYRRDEVTGRTWFTAMLTAGGVPKNKKRETVCVGVLPILDTGTPMYLTGEPERSVQGTYLHVSAFRFGCESQDDAMRFLQAMPGVGRKTAESIYSVTGTDLFAPHTVAAFIEAGVPEDKANSLVRKIQDLSVLAEILNVILPFGGTYTQACTLRRVFGKKAAQTFLSHPFRAVYNGIPFALCERAKETPVFDEERADALVYSAMKMGESGGNTCLTLREICQNARWIEKDRHTGPLFLTAALLRNTDHYVQIKEPEKILFFRRELYREEESAANDIVRLMRTKVTFPLIKTDIAQIESDSNVVYGEQQKQAFALFASSGVKILTGGPGTGKTTTVNGLIRFFRQMFPEAAISLCAPTANAAKRLKASTGLPAETVHRLLGVRPLGNTMVTDKDRYAKLQADLLIVDEASMLDVHLLQMLLAAMPDHATVLLVGDEDQLASIGAGNVLHDLLEIPEIEKCRLTDVYRQAQTSSIVANSIQIRKGNADLLLDGQTEARELNTGDELANTAVDLLISCKRNGEEAVILSPVRAGKYVYGTQKLNSMAQKELNPNGEYLQCGENLFKKGDPIVMTRNDYEKGYINGDEGFVVEVSPKRHCMIVNIDGRELGLRGKALLDVDLNYAKTVHKSQGGEYDICIIVLPEEPSSMLLRRMTYVAATRAKKKNIFLSQRQAFGISVANVKEKERKTYLKERIEKEFSL